MKRILLIIFLFLCFINVNALERKFAGSEVLTGISYMKSDGKIVQYKNTQVIRDLTTNEVAYCVEPFTLLVDNSDYVSSTSNNTFGISSDKWEKIKLYAYYGYGYQSHLDKKWISITQLSIWRTLFPSYTFEWIDNVNSKNIIKPYNKELEELNNLVNRHSLKPKFENEYYLKINDTITLDDKNNVLDNYSIKYSDFLYEKKDNTLKIDAGKEVKEGKIIFEKVSNNYSSFATYFYNSTSQNVMERGNVLPVTFEINITTYDGNITVNKVDNDKLDNSNASLDGAIFDLYDSNMNYISSTTIEDGKGLFDNLLFGKYYIKESKAGVGYYLNQEVYEVTIDKDNIEKEITIGNSIIKSKVKIIKYYGTRDNYKNNQMKKEEGITFKIYDLNNNLVASGITDQNGELEFSLTYGKYILKQINTTSGYQINDDYLIDINENSSHSIDITLYDFKIKVPNARVDLFQYIRQIWNTLLK